MSLGRSISCVSEVVGAFLRCEGGEEPTDRCGEVLGGACGGFAQEVFELGKDLLDRVEVGRVFRQEQQFGAGRADEPAHGFALWLPRLSMTTMSPAFKVGRRTCST